jgi:hypothetical protein
MSIRTRLFALPLPGFVRKACVRRLARLTAQAFQSAPPSARGLSCEALLERYAVFTAEHAEALLSVGAPAIREETGERLFSNARDLGKRIRVWLGIRGTREVMDVARALYRVIGVDFRGRANAGTSTFTVARCYFSSHYSPEVCRLISGLDAGLLSGLSDGRELVFTKRVTEGAALCAGVLG